MSLFLENPKDVPYPKFDMNLSYGNSFYIANSSQQISADKRNQCFLGVSIGVHMWENAFPVFGRNDRVLKKTWNEHHRATYLSITWNKSNQKCHRLIVRVLVATEVPAVLVFGDRVLVPVAATVEIAATVACPRTVLGQNFPNHETGRGNAKTESVVSERRETFDVFALEVPTRAAPGPGLGPGPGSVTTITGPSKGTGLGSTAASKTTTTTNNKGTMRKDRDKRPLSPGNI